MSDRAPVGTSRLHEPLAKAVGGRTAAALTANLGLRTVGDLLRHYPRRYLDPHHLTELGELKVGDHVSVVAQVCSSTVRKMASRPGRIMDVIVTDGDHKLTLTFFNPKPFQIRDLRLGARAVFTGTVSAYKGKRQLSHPRYEMFDDDEEPDTEEVAERVRRPMPVYPASEKVDSSTIARTVQMQLSVLPGLPDPLPVEVRARHGLMDLLQALRSVHRPADSAEAHVARHRLRFEEAFVLQAALARRRWFEGFLPATPRVPRPDGLLAAFEQRLPFELTAGQREVGREIAEDLAREHPMHRLLQGEVGSGKTLVALLAMLAVVDAGGQAALLAPTEVLATQHHRSITAMLGDLAGGGLLGGHELGTRVALLTGSLGTAARRSALLETVSGDAGIVVGTHALLQENVEFQDLGLVVVDEQHRFGVDQRDALRGKGRTTPHLLVMTATPIPRTVAMTVFGDLDVSTLTELPLGRAPIASHVVPGERPSWMDRTWARVREEAAKGHQTYVVCPRIGTDDEPEGGPAEDGSRRPVRSVLEVVDELRDRPETRELRVEMLHGRMPPDERDAVMRSFAAGKVDVLVATTVIEVGVDVPNASVMVVLDAERFGVSQLHQLRGRVGRGGVPGLCLLVTGTEPGTPGRERVEAVAGTLDGFELARVDLEQRREGDVLGATQSGGRSSLRLLRVLQHEDLIAAARHEASAVVATDPDLSGHPALSEAIADLLDPEREVYLDRG